MKRVHINSSRSERGVALVEFAFVLPLLTILLLGVFYFVMLLRQHQIVQNAVREGARYSSLLQNSGDVTGVQDIVTNYLAQENITINSSDVSVDQDYSIDLGGGLIATGTKITVSYAPSLPVGTTLFGSVTLNAQAVFRNLY